ncbi:MAG: mechanosensitive ion channel family protein [Myxococcales bacterium]|nr:mechanosensitive ion channel family protein [Myxococcales bacterium]MCB9707574.1 mechanosensitive ion channel family protein [Myxococcales bacterium]
MNPKDVLRALDRAWPAGGDFKGDIAATFALVIVVFLFRLLVARLVRRLESLPEGRKLRWSVQLRWVSYLAIIVGLFVIWATELRTMAVTVMALAVAIVIATKELLLCVLGTILRTSAAAFSVGDRIEINGIRGDVIDHGLLATTVLEIGPGLQRTGRAVTIPNSQLLHTAVVNETFTDAYVLHVITIPLRIDADWPLIEQATLAVARQVCAEFLSEARKYMYASARIHGLTMPFVEPRVVVQVPVPGQVHLLLRVPTPAREKGRTEQRILRAVLEQHGSAFFVKDP